MAESSEDKRKVRFDLNNNKDNDIKSEYKAMAETDPKTHLQTFFELLDEKHFNKALTEMGVKAIWSKRLRKNFGSVKVIQDSNAIEIRLALKLLESSPRLEILSILHKYMKKVMKMTSEMPSEDTSKPKDTTEWRDRAEEVYIEDSDEESNSDSYEDSDEDSDEDSNEELSDKYHKESESLAKEITRSLHLDCCDLETIRAIELESLVDERLQFLDPKPDINRLLREYDDRYFGGVLHKNEVEVLWSDRMIRTTGVTRGETAEKPIQITLSRKLLRYGLRKQIVETILHEMIHAFHYALRVDAGADGHGMPFLKMMNELNAKTKANITVYHNLYVDREKFLAQVEEDRRKREAFNEEHRKKFFLK